MGEREIWVLLLPPNPSMSLPTLAPGVLLVAASLCCPEAPLLSSCSAGRWAVMTSCRSKSVPTRLWPITGPKMHLGAGPPSASHEGFLGVALAARKSLAPSSSGIA